MRSGLLAFGVTAIIAGIVLFLVAPSFPVEAVTFLGTVEVPNPYLRYSGIGLGMVGILLIILGVATQKNPPPQCPPFAVRRFASKQRKKPIL
jgi:uncharacterized protein YjeT (DUF2065 family)